VVNVIALMLADSRTPTGGYAHSGGLEAALAAGLTTEEIPAFLAARLRTVAFVDAAFAAAAVRAGDDPGRLAELEAEWLARTPSPALRRAASALGRALLRVGNGIGLGSPALAAWASISPATPRCLVLGAVARGAGIEASDVSRLALYDDAAMLCGAAPKLVAIDALTASGWLAAEAPLIARLADEAAHGPGLPVCSTPALELLAECHATSERRLFAS
jgi:urease accessory protein